jgi:transposase
MRGNELSKTQREQIIGAYFSGTKQVIISTQLGIPTSTVNDTIKRYKETGFTEPKKCPGRPKVLNKYDTQALKRIIQTD